MAFIWIIFAFLNFFYDIFNLFVCSCFESVFNFVKTWFLCRFSSIGFWLFVVDSASSLSFFCCWDSTLISFDAMHCYCLSLKPIVFSAAEGIVFVICVRMICGFASSFCAFNFSFNVSLCLVLVSLSDKYWMFCCLLVALCWFILHNWNLMLVITSLWSALLLKLPYILHL